MRCTGVAKSVTFSGRCSSAGSVALATSTTTLPSWLRRSGVAPSPLKRRTSRPAPPSPRLKSIWATLARAGAVLAAAGCSAGVEVEARLVAEARANASPTRPQALKVAGRRRLPGFRSLEKVIVLSPNH